MNSSQENYKQLFEAASVGIAKVSPGGSWLEINPKMCDMLQYTRDELLALTFQDITHPEDLDKDLSYVNAMLNKEIDHYSMEKRYFKKDGAIIWINLSVTLICHPDGSPDYFISIIDDIDEKVAARNTILELKEKSEYDSERYRNLLMMSSDGIIIYDEKEQVIEVNATQARMLGYSPQEMIGMTAYDWDLTTSPETAAKVETLNEIEPIEFETVHHRKDGSTYDALVSAGMFSAGGKHFIYSSTRDITEQKRAQRSIVEERNLAKHYLDIAGSLIIAMDTDANITLINKEGCRILEAEEQDIVGKNWFKTFLISEELEMVKGWFAQLMRGEVENVRYAENYIHSLQGNTKLIAWYNSIIYDDNGNITGLLSSGQDITKQRQLIEEVETQKQRFELAVAGTHDGLWDWDLTTNQAYHSIRFETMLGYSGNELPGTAEAWSSLIHPDDAEQAFKTVQEYLASKGTTQFENTFRMRTKEGKWRWITGRGKALFAEDGTPLRFIGFNTDVTKEVEHQQELDFASKHDPLTGLANRFLLNEFLQQALYHSQRLNSLVAVVYLDLDGFKNINDTQGHEAGDLVLKETTFRMQRILRKEDVLARLGGDEFVIIISDFKHEEEILPLLNRLLKDIKQPIKYDSVHELILTASIGVTFYPQEAEVGSEVLIRQADQAMYEAKKKGKNQHAFFDLVNEKMMTHYQQEVRRIEDALENNQFELYYQPKVEMNTGTILGFEALLRWNDPEHGLVTPESFLPLVTNNKKVMISIGLWVFKQAFKQLSDWKAQGYKWQMSINVSNHEIHDEQFIDMLQTLLKEHTQVNAKDIELEILESAALEDISYVKDIIIKAQDIGFSIALDDFGTAYSTLAYLKELPINTLKIDKSFVQDMSHDTGSLSIIEASIALAEAFRCKVIAEGVEEVEHGNTLLQLGCNVAQGYVISKPMPAIEVENWSENFTRIEPWVSMEQIKTHQRTVLYSLIEHKNWVNSVIDFIQKNNTYLPPMNSKKCRFGEWLNSHETESWLDKTTLERLHTQHDLLHKQAQKLINATIVDQHELDVLKKQHHKLIFELEQLIAAD